MLLHRLALTRPGRPELTIRWPCLRFLAALTVTALVPMSSVLLAHHSGAMYDGTKTVTLHGKVKVFRWVNPHAVIVMTTDAKPGEEANDWAIEMSSPGNMARYNWTRTSLQAGDAVEIVAAPMRDGTHGGACRKVTLLDKAQTLECAAGAAIRAGEPTN